jgi:hypothetical protein
VQLLAMLEKRSKKWWKMCPHWRYHKRTKTWAVTARSCRALYYYKHCIMFLT